MSKQTKSRPEGTGSERKSMFSGLRRAFGSNSSSSGKRAEAENQDKAEEANAERFAITNPFREEPPPSYSEAQQQQTQAPGSSTSSRRPTQGASADKFRFLADFDTAFLIDDSGSMVSKDDGRYTSRSRWEQTRDVIKQVVPVCTKYDEDGVDLYFLNDVDHKNFDEEEPSWCAEGIEEEGKGSHVYHNITSPKVVNRIFENRTPAGLTPTGPRLDGILGAYIGCYERRVRDGQEAPKPLNIIVITDGAHTGQNPANILIRHARKLDALEAPYYQVGVQFFQVGQDPGAAAALTTLDNCLGDVVRDQELRDMVDCITYKELDKRGQPPLSVDTVLKVVLGAVNKRLDNKRLSAGKLVR
ncbi:hypothetical protein GGS20DRAFT_139569 [Poronia punctata]|nr:hypothetical protein GGS20DRAFT_139569 [Poronia punctata]